MMEDWAVRLLPVDADGSCFFSSIAIALNESMHSWGKNKKITKILRDHWYSFLELGLESPDNFTSKFVRYITSTSIDQDDLEAHNNIASADDKRKFDSVTKLAEHVLHTNCWVDTVTFGAFLKSLDCSVAVVVIDHDIKEPLCVFDEVVQNKDFYICLWLQDYHYEPIQLVYKERDLPLCVSRESILAFMGDCYPKHLSKY